MFSNEFLSKPLKESGLPAVQLSPPNGNAMSTQSNIPTLKRAAYSSRDDQSALESENPSNRQKKSETASTRFGADTTARSPDEDDKDMGDGDDDDEGDDDSPEEDDDDENGSDWKSRGGSGKTPRKPNHWSPDEDAQLRAAVQLYGEKHWRKIAEMVPGRNQTQCLQRWQKVLRPGLKKGQWDQEEDDLLVKIVNEQKKYLNSTKNKIQWNMVSKQIPGRTPKQCRERWNHNINPCIRKGPWEAWEDKVLLEKVKEHGAQHWSFIARFLDQSASGMETTYRTEAAAKNRYHSLTKDASGRESIDEQDTQSSSGKNAPSISSSSQTQMMTEQTHQHPHQPHHHRQQQQQQFPSHQINTDASEQKLPYQMPIAGSMQMDPNRHIDSTMKSLSSLSVSKLPIDQRRNDVANTQAPAGLGPSMQAVNSPLASVGAPMGSMGASISQPMNFGMNPNPFTNYPFAMYPNSAPMYNPQPMFSGNTSMPLQSNFMMQKKEKSAEMMSQLGMILSQSKNPDNVSAGYRPPYQPGNMTHQPSMQMIPPPQPYGTNIPMQHSLGYGDAGSFGHIYDPLSDPHGIYRPSFSAEAMASMLNSGLSNEIPSSIFDSSGEGGINSGMYTAGSLGAIPYPATQYAPLTQQIPYTANALPALPSFASGLGGYAQHPSNRNQYPSVPKLSPPSQDDRMR